MPLCIMSQCLLEVLVATVPLQKMKELRQKHSLTHSLFEML